MISRAKQHYFSNKNYTLLYLHRFFFRMACAVTYIFTGAYLLNSGLALPLVILYYAAEFGLRGVLCPTGTKIIHKIGIPKTMLISAMSFVAFYFLMSLAENYMLILIVAVIFQAIAGALYYPYSDIIEALYVEDDSHRGKQYSLSVVVSSLGSAIGVVTIGFLLTFASYFEVAIFASIAMLCSAIPTFYLKRMYARPQPITEKEVYSFMKSKEYRPFMALFFAEQLAIIMQCVFIPLFIFSVVGKFDVMGVLLLGALIVEMVVTLLLGHHIDTHGNAKAMRKSFLMMATTSALYATIVVNPFTAFLAESWNKFSYNSFYSTLVTGVHKMVRRDSDDLFKFTTCWQMSLCYGEIIILPLLALLTCFIGEGIFYVVFALSAIGGYMAMRFFEKNKL